MFSRLVSSLSIGLLAPASFADVCQNQWVSQAPGLSGGGGADISADGRLVVFSSLIPFLPGDVNNRVDVYVRDLVTGAFELVSVASDGTQGNDPSHTASISGDGRYVAFWSLATNLVPNDTNGWIDAFVRDRAAGTTVRVSVASDGSQADHPQFDWDVFDEVRISTDGRWVTFMSYSPNLDPSDGVNLPDVFVHDLQNGITERVSVPLSGSQGGGMDPAISADGRYVVFTSDASNLVASDTNGKRDVFIRDRQLRITRCASRGNLGVESNGFSQTPALSADGRYVAFRSDATNIVPLNYPGVLHVYVRDRGTDTTFIADVGSMGMESNRHTIDYPMLSPDGGLLAFIGLGTNLVGAGGDPSGFHYELYVRDFETGITAMATAAGSLNFPGGTGPFHHSGAFSGDGRRLAFVSNVGFAAGDTNHGSDVYVHDRGSGGDFPTHCSAETAPCPCSGPTGPGAGCPNSWGAGGAYLRADGTASVSADTLVLQCTGAANHGATVIFLQGTLSSSGIVLGDGLRCVAGTIRRLATKAGQYSQACFGYDVGADPLVSVRGNVPAQGGTYYYQTWYRDHVTGFCTSATTNLTNGLTIVWSP